MLTGVMIFISYQVYSNPESGTKEQGDVYRNLPFSMPEVSQPSFPDYEVNIRDFGALSDGVTLNTEAINNAIKAVSSKGGGKVIIPEGLWLTGPVVLLSNVNLYVEKNALIVFSSDTSLYPIIDTSFEGLETKRCQSPISAMNAENIAITGNGVFDGAGDRWRPVKKDKMTERQWKNLVSSGGKVDENGKVWYPDAGALKASVLMTGQNNGQKEITDEEWTYMKSWLRPVMLSIVKSKRILLEGVTFKNSPGWCIHPLSCESLTLNDVKVFNPWYSQNGDALDVESCKNVLVTNCFFDAGDDAICLKSGKDEDGRRRGEPCENVIIKNNTVLHGHGGFVIGSEMSGGVRNVYVSGCSFVGTDVGLRFKSTRGRGGVVENIFIDNINMIDIPNDALTMDLYYAVNDFPETPIPDVNEETPVFRNIYISNVLCRGAGRAVYFNGLPEMPLKNIFIKNMTVTNAKKGIVINQASQVNMENIKVERGTINQMAEGLEETEKMKNEFISSVSHELRTPLTSIRGWVETLRTLDDPEDENYRKGLEIINNETARLYNMVEELLDFSRLQNGRLKMDCRLLDLVAELTDAVLFCEARIQREGLLLSYNEPEEMIPVYADPDRLRQVFINILDNAIKYSAPGGRITVKIWQGEYKAFIEIIDQGRGIPPEDLENVKTKFYKGSNSVRGSGIGLALVDSIMTALDGTLDLKSTLGRGTVVTLGLPLYKR